MQNEATVQQWLVSQTFTARHYCLCDKVDMSNETELQFHNWTYDVLQWIC